MSIAFHLHLWLFTDFFYKDREGGLDLRIDSLSWRWILGGWFLNFDILLRQLVVLCNAIWRSFLINTIVLDYLVLEFVFQIGTFSFGSTFGNLFWIGIIENLKVDSFWSELFLIGLVYIYFLIWDAAFGLQLSCRVFQVVELQDAKPLTNVLDTQVTENRVRLEQFVHVVPFIS